MTAVTLSVPLPYPSASVVRSRLVSIIAQALPENSVCDHAYSKPENKSF
jgi:hypothetical protein